MVTLKAVSDFCKMWLPFGAGAWSLVLAYLDKHRGWKLVGSLLGGLFLLGIGIKGILG